MNGDAKLGVDPATIQFAARLPKSGGQLSECEDRFGSIVGVSNEFRVAISDGASASLLAGEWAEMLVEAYCSSVGDDPLDLTERIGVNASAWGKMVADLELPWYAQAKLGSGAFASLVGISIKCDGRWTAAAVGDSCVFQVRRHRGDTANETGCIASFPLSRVGQFGSTPALIGTQGAEDGWRLTLGDGHWLPDDDLYLMTDALAEWFLAELQQKREPWRWFDALTSAHNGLALEKFIGDLRTSGKLKDDDVTLVHVKLKEASPESDG